MLAQIAKHGFEQVSFAVTRAKFVKPHQAWVPAGIWVHCQSVLRLRFANLAAISHTDPADKRLTKHHPACADGLGCGRKDHKW